jgi:hypothetical protein
MRTFKVVLVWALFLVLFLPIACERTVEEELIKPVERMVEQRDDAVLEAAVANVRQIRSGLMRYPAVSADNEYPSDIHVFNYDTLRETLSSENLPPNMADLMWDPAFGMNYSSDGLSFTFQVRALTKESELITATTRGVEW